VPARREFGYAPIDALNNAAVVGCPRLKFLLALLLAISLPARANEIPDWFAETFLDVREDAAEAAKDGKRLMLYFWLEGCPYCRQLESITFKDPQVAGRMRRELLPVAINVRGDREVTWTDGTKMSEKQFTAYLKVRGTPTLVFFDEKGAVIERAVGYLEPARFSALLDRARAPRSSSSQDRPAPTSQAPRARRRSPG
jgi:thioredoxin-related protein